MSDVYLARVDSPDFEETVEAAVDVGEFEDVPDPLSGAEEGRLWGVGPGSRNESNFEKLESGDLVLFYRDGEYVGSAWVEATFDDAWASETLWEDSDVTMCYTLSGYQAISVPKRKVNTIFGYSEGYSPSELMRVNPDNVDAQPAAIELALERVS